MHAFVWHAADQFGKPPFMHELALMESLVETVEAELGDTRVLVVRVAVGRLTCVVPDALRFCFDVCIAGSPCLEGASLDIVEIPARASCRSCGADGPVEGPVPMCRCGSFDLHLYRGNELRLVELEVL